MTQSARAARGRIPKRGLGLGSAVRRIRELRGLGQEVLAERSGLSQGYLSQIESEAWTGVTEDVLGRIAKALSVDPWVILAQAAGLKLDQVELVPRSGLVSCASRSVMYRWAATTSSCTPVTVLVIANNLS